MMPEEALSADSSAAQPPFKFTNCLGGCGTSVPYRTNSKVYCTTCKIEKKRESSRKSADIQRRKNDVKKVKGEPFICAECGRESIATSGNNQKYCRSCAPGIALESARDRSFEIDLGGRERFRGKFITCVDCSSEFTADRRRSRCVECTDANKRKPHCGTSPCKQCGVEFKSNTRKRIYCDACAGTRRAETFRTFARKKFNEMRGDAAFDLNTLMRSRMRHSLTLTGGKAGASWSKLVGYTVGELKAHIERQFLPGMTWENRGRGGWHIDHILPIISFDYDGPDHPDFKACWSLTNLRPLWESDNLSKSDKILYII